MNGYKMNQKDLINATELTAPALARRLGIDEKSYTIYNWKRGLSKIPDEYLVKIKRIIKGMEKLR